MKTSIQRHACVLHLFKKARTRRPESEGQKQNSERKSRFRRPSPPACSSDVLLRYVPCIYLPCLLRLTTAHYQGASLNCTNLCFGEGKWDGACGSVMIARVFLLPLPDLEGTRRSPFDPDDGTASMTKLAYMHLTFSIDLCVLVRYRLPTLILTSPPPPSSSPPPASNNRLSRATTGTPSAARTIKTRHSNKGKHGHDRLPYAQGRGGRGRRHQPPKHTEGKPPSRPASRAPQNVHGETLHRHGRGSLDLLPGKQAKEGNWERRRARREWEGTMVRVGLMHVCFT